MPRYGPAPRPGASRAGRGRAGATRFFGALDRRAVLVVAGAAAVLLVGLYVAGAHFLHRGSPYERARAAWEAQDYEASAEAYEEFFAASPPAGPEAEAAELQLADIYNFKLKQYDRARDRYADFLARFPDSESAPAARRRLADALVETGNRPEAIVQLEQLAAAEPDGTASPEWRKLRVAVADLYFESNDFSQAELEYSRAVEVAPDRYDDLTEHSLLRTASIYHMVRDQNERAIPLYERIATSTADPLVKRQALYALSECYATLFRFDEAVATLGRVDDPEEADYVARRVAELRRQKKDHADAPEVDWSRGGRGEGT